jgi:3,4-dihydroxy 2-butanone 4-phosphate synthase/GTP cyclohydrolase II
VTAVRTIDPKLAERIAGAIADIRAGKMIILVDDEDRENEGDLTMAAQFVTPEAINFMATHGRGLICLALDEDQIDRLKLPMMKSPGRLGPPLGTAFTVSIEARSGRHHGHQRGRSRAHHSRGGQPERQARRRHQPRSRLPAPSLQGGVLVRTGQTEGSVDLAQLADLTPAGVICEIMRKTARWRACRISSFSPSARSSHPHDRGPHSLSPLHRDARAPIARGDVTLDQTGSEWRAIVYETTIDDRQFLALVKGDLGKPGAPLCRVHTGSTVADTFAATPSDGGLHLREAIAQIEAVGSRSARLHRASRRRAPGARGPAGSCGRPAARSKRASLAGVRARRPSARRPRASSNPASDQQSA